MADWDINPRHHPGYLDADTDLEQFQDNYEYIAGELAAQTAIVGEVPLQFRSPLTSTHADGLDQVKDIGTIIANGLARNSFEYNSHAPTGVTVPLESRFKMAIENTTGANRQMLGDMVFGRESENNGFFQIFAYGLGSGLIAIDSQGRVGILTETPEYELDVPSGIINVSGDYRRAGVVIVDWTVAAGPTVTHSGPARVTGIARTTMATGTAPLAATSTTECTNLSAAALNGERWHPGIMAHGFDTYGAGDTDIVVEPVNRIGTWIITATYTVHLEQADAGLTINCKLKDGGGTQIGETTDFEASPPASGFSAVSVKVTGVYVSAAGNENIKATVGVPTGTGSSVEVVMTMAWQGP